MTPATLVRWTTLVASLWASLTYASASDSALPLVVLSPLVLLGWFLGGGAHGRRLPIHQGVLTGAVVAVIGWAGLRVLSEGPTVEVFSESVMLLLAAKLADHRRARDTSQIVALTVFLAIGSILTSNTLLVGLMVLAMVPIGAALVLSFQIAAAAARADGCRVQVRGGVGRGDDRVLVPEAALVRREEGWSVFRVVGNTAEEVPIEIDHRDGRSAAATAGIEVGDRVVLYPSDRLANGVRVAER